VAPPRRFEVEDNGCGIAASALTAAWEPFVSSKGPGRGLGLAAVVGIVHSHRGELRISTYPGAGTLVRVWLPAGEGATVAGEPGRPTALAPLSGRVLVVDDEDAVREVIAELCAALGLETEQAASGEDCLARLTTDRRGFDVVLLDVTMPGIGGVAAWEAFALSWPKLPVVLMSGQPIPKLPERAGRLTPSFLLKPFGLDRLRAVLADAIAAR
jgi:two-component system cell cycle sensor histidine kinase/response regulator CckA